MDKFFYDNKVENILTELRDSLYDIVKSRGPIQLYEYGKYRLVVGSYREAVADKLYIENDVLMLKCSYWVSYEVEMDCDFKTSHTNIGNMTYTDYLNIYKLVVEIIND